MYPEAEYRRLPGKLDLVGMRLIIQNVLTGSREIHTLPKGFLVSYLCWMADGREVLFSAADRNVNTVDVIYRYPLDTRELIPLINPRDNSYVSDWRPGRLYVSPKGKLTGLWGCSLSPIVILPNRVFVRRLSSLSGGCQFQYYLFYQLIYTRFRECQRVSNLTILLIGTKARENFSFSRVSIFRSLGNIAVKLMFRTSSSSKAASGSGASHNRPTS